METNTKTQQETIQSILAIANGKIPVLDTEPIYQVFSARKHFCSIVGTVPSEEVSFVVRQIINCNNEIKKYFNIW